MGFPQLNLDTVKQKFSADKNICGNNNCGSKITVFLKQVGHFTDAKIFTANIFIRKFFGDNGREMIFFLFFTFKLLNYFSEVPVTFKRFCLPV
jgi:hypothetical protein